MSISECKVFLNASHASSIVKEVLKGGLDVVTKGGLDVVTHNLFLKVISGIKGGLDVVTHNLFLN